MSIDVNDYDRVVTLKWLRSGQPRPYADSVYEAEITFTGRNTSTRPDIISVCGCHPPEDVVKRLARVLVHDWSDNPTGCAAYLSACQCVEKSPGVSRWLVRVVSPFSD